MEEIRQFIGKLCSIIDASFGYWSSGKISTTWKLSLNNVEYNWDLCKSSINFRYYILYKYQYFLMITTICCHFFFSIIIITAISFSIRSILTMVVINYIHNDGSIMDNCYFFYWIRITLTTWYCYCTWLLLLFFIRLRIYISDSHMSILYILHTSVSHVYRIIKLIVLLERFFLKENYFYIFWIIILKCIIQIWQKFKFKMGRVFLIGYISIWIGNW